MERAGVKGAPEIHFPEQIEEVPVLGPTESSRSASHSFALEPHRSPEKLGEGTSASGS